MVTASTTRERGEIENMLWFVSALCAPGWRGYHLPESSWVASNILVGGTIKHALRYFVFCYSDRSVRISIFYTRGLDDWCVRVPSQKQTKMY